MSKQKVKSVELYRIRTLLVLLLVLHVSLFAFVVLWQKQATTGTIGTPQAEGARYGDLRTGLTDRSITIDGTERTYTLYIPYVFRQKEAFPVVFNLHGSGNDARGQMALSSMNSLAFKEKFVVVYPNAINGEWNDGRFFSRATSDDADDVEFMKAILTEIDQDLSINLDRVYATGMSNGAMMAHRLACDAADVFAAVAPVAGTMPSELRPNCKPAQNISVLTIMGSADPAVPYEGGEILGGQRGSVLSATETANFWKNINGCTKEVTSQLPDREEDGTVTYSYLEKNCKNGVVTEHLKVDNGGHTWPGGLQYAPKFIIGNTSQDFSATEHIWSFFKDDYRSR